MGIASRWRCVWDLWPVADLRLVPALVVSSGQMGSRYCMREQARLVLLCIFSKLHLLLLLWQNTWKKKKKTAGRKGDEEEGRQREGRVYILPDSWRYSPSLWGRQSGRVMRQLITLQPVRKKCWCGPLPLLISWLSNMGSGEMAQWLKSPDWSSRGQGFNSQYPHGTDNDVTPKPSSGLCRQCLLMVYRHTHRQKHLYTLNF